MPRVPGEQASPKSAGSEDPSYFLTWGMDTTGSEDGEDSRDANRLTEVCECRLSRHHHVLRLCECCADREISILLKAEKFGLDHHDSSQCEIKDFTCGREMKAVAPRRGTPAPRAASQETQGGTGAAEGRVDGPRGCRPRSGADHAGAVIPDALGDFYFESRTGFRNTENWRNSAPASGELTVQSSRGRRCVSGGRSFRAGSEMARPGARPQAPSAASRSHAAFLPLHAHRLRRGDPRPLPDGGRLRVLPALCQAPPRDGGGGLGLRVSMVNAARATLTREEDDRAAIRYASTSSFT